MDLRLREMRRLSMWLLLGLSLLANGIQGTKLLHLYDDVDQRNTGSTLAPGVTVPVIQAKTLEGKLESIDYASSSVPTVLYVFQPGCSWCERNSENIAAMTRQLSGKYRFVGLSLATDGLPEFLKKHQIQFPIYLDLPPSVIEAYRIESTPQTIVVSPQGKVMNVWQGAYLGVTASQIEKFFSIRLPAAT